MIEGVDGLDELVEIEIDSKGKLIEPKHDKTIIVDADTIAFGTCTQFEYELFGEWEISLDEAFANFYDKLDYILEQIGGKRENTELYFTGTPYSFRYALLAEAFPQDESMWYKAKRKGKRKPAGIRELKQMIVERSDMVRTAQIFDKFEADDYVTLRKEEEPEAILTGVDKDVLLNTPGRHFNYYSSMKHQIDMKWVDVTPEQALYHIHLQTIIGDKSDNVPGLPGVGPAKASKFIEHGMTEREMWEAVIAAYNTYCDYGDPEEMALLNTRLIRMNQLVRNGDNIDIVLWSPNQIKE
jgi:hypothetical protein